MLTVGSLYSGIAGIELGLERTGGFRTIWFSEVDEYASAVLKKHWPNVPNHGDIRTIPWRKIERPDMLTGGFPCQDVSVAGKKRGIKEGTRSGLWSEYAKAIRILRPKYALIENVPNLANIGLNQVLSDLAKIGYDAEWNIISAASVGAPHRRERLFILAYPSVCRCDHTTDSKTCRREGIACKKAERISVFANDRSKRVQGFSQGQIQRFQEFSWCENVRGVEDLRNRSNIPEPLIRRVDSRISNYVDRIKCIGNSVVPAVAQVIGEMILEAENMPIK